jgi:hypothetical protein
MRNESSLADVHRPLNWVAGDTGVSAVTQIGAKVHKIHSYDTAEERAARRERSEEYTTRCNDFVQ